jgi:uncharacterized damage-inducible protein DinB
MAIVDPFIQELEYEGGLTRKALERIPTGKLGFKPHPKSMTIGQLGSHLAETLEWTSAITENSEFDFVPEEYTPKAARSTAEILAAFDASLKAAKEALRTLSDVGCKEPWTFKTSGKVVFQLPRIAVVRSMILSHSYHHRGQLTVYLRLLDIPVPSIYGPSADES